MKKPLIFIALLMLCFTGYSQSLAFTDLIQVYNKPDEPNKLLDSKGFNVTKRIPSQNHNMLVYKKNPDTGKEESISTGIGMYTADKIFHADLYYIVKDSIYVVNLMKQVSKADYKLDDKSVVDDRKFWTFSNDAFVFRFTIVKDRNYMVMLSQKYK